MTKGWSPVQGKVRDQEVSHTRLEHFLLLLLRTRCRPPWELPF